MKPIVGPDGKPLHRTARQLITPALPRALGAWAKNVDSAIVAEHAPEGEQGPGGEHVDLRFPKAAIWIRRLSTANSFVPGSVVGTEPASSRASYAYGGSVGGGYFRGDLTFTGGFPGELVVLDTIWVDRSHALAPPTPYERRWEISGRTLHVFLPSPLAGFGVVIY